jgi:lipopolysaccharide/colanic/teichoic acid biosynthesis glycosyltransferase
MFRGGLKKGANIVAVGLSGRQQIAKRILDVFLAIIGLVLFSWMILLGWFIATIDTRQNGFFLQDRIGKNGERFRIWKLRTMREDPYHDTSVTTQSDPRITKSGAFLRKTKWNELPQLINVLLGSMSFVGPRPEVPGFADELEGDDRVILTTPPGITGRATLRFRHEEIVLDSVDDPDAYNVDILFPEKVQLNREYVENYSVFSDLKYVFMTVFALAPIDQIQAWIDREVEPMRIRQVELAAPVELPLPVEPADAARYAETG